MLKMLSDTVTWLSAIVLCVLLYRYNYCWKCDDEVNKWVGALIVFVGTFATFLKLLNLKPRTLIDCPIFNFFYEIAAVIFLTNIAVILIWSQILSFTKVFLNFINKCMTMVCNKAGITVNNQLLTNEKVYSFILYVQVFFFMYLVIRAVLSQMSTTKLQRFCNYFRGRRSRNVTFSKTHQMWLIDKDNYDIHNKPILITLQDSSTSDIRIKNEIAHDKVDVSFH